MWTAENLETEGVQDVEGSSFVLVHRTHPVAELLQEEEEDLFLFDEACVQDGEWVTVGRFAFAACCETVRRGMDGVARELPF